MARIEADNKKLIELFNRTRKYIIPEYQRHYRWSEEDILDLYQSLHASSQVYFIGTFSLTRDDTSRFEVIDGQQRLISLTIIFAALRDVLAASDSRSLNTIAGEIHALYVRNSRGTVAGEFKLQPHRTLSEFFEFNIQIFNPDTPRVALTLDLEDVEKLQIAKNYNFIKKEITEELVSKSPAKQQQFIEALLTHLEENIEIIEVIFNSDEDAYTVFENLNAKGIPLNQADLIKNLLFKSFTGSIEEKDKLIERWDELESIFLLNPSDLQQFIRYQWMSENGYITSPRLYTDIKKKITDTGTQTGYVQRYVSKILEQAKIYNKLKNSTPLSSNDSGYTSSIIRKIEAINILKIEQCYVLLLAIFANEKETRRIQEKLLELIEVFSFNYQYISKLPANKLERTYAKYAKQVSELFESEPSQEKIRVELDRVVAKITEELSTLKPPYEFFEEKFVRLTQAETTESKNQFRYILSRFEISRRRGTRPDFQQCNIEHIYPKRATLGIDKQFVFNLGNLTLLTSEENNEAGNKPPLDKIDIYKKTDFKLTNEVVSILESNKKWGTDEIMARVKEMSLEAYEDLWKF